MTENDVMQIKVGKITVGIIGLKKVVEEMAQDYGEKSDEEVGYELLKRLSKRNYIPDKARRSYATAFLREFKKLLGKPHEEVDSQGLEIKVLGPGCVQCDRLEHELMAVMAETGIVADIEHVRDIKKIGEYGVMGTPALLVNGKVKSVGTVPPKNKLIEWLKEARRE